MKKSFFADVVLELLGLSYDDMKRTIPSDDCTDWERKYSGLFSGLMNSGMNDRGGKTVIRVPVRTADYCSAGTGRAVGK